MLYAVCAHVGWREDVWGGGGGMLIDSHLMRGMKEVVGTLTCTATQDV